MSRIIFTDELLQTAARSPRHQAPLLHQWVNLSGERGEVLREQIERAASRVPEGKRPQVLGPLLAKSSSDDQIAATVGSLLLAKTLTNLGWVVEFEPEEAGGTPDFRIRKGEKTYVVEVRRVEERKIDSLETAVARIRDALVGIKTRTPISIRSASVGGGASLKPFVRNLKTLLDTGPPPGRHSYHEGEVYVRYDVINPFEEPINVVAGWSGGRSTGDQNEEVRKHINEKLGKYKIPANRRPPFFRSSGCL